MPVGVRPRQLSVRTLLVAMVLTQHDGRPAHLTRVRAVLLGLSEEVKVRLGVVTEWRSGRHELTYRQVEYTASVLSDLLKKPHPDGSPSGLFQEVIDALIEASIPTEMKDASSSYACDWSDLESYSCPPPRRGGPCADMEASWGHRRGKGPGQRDELFFGYYFQLATMVADEGGEAVPDLVRRLLLTSCHLDPPPAFVRVLQDMVAGGVEMNDVLADAGYAHRSATSWALPLRALGASLVQDLHPHDRGTQGTHEGAICYNGALYCPATPPALFRLEPPARQASPSELAVHDELSAELARYKLGRVARDDADGFHRVSCPAVLGKLRCPLREGSLALSYARPEILAPPAHPPRCCSQRTITVPVEVNAKTRQKHDYPSAAHRRSYSRRSAVERANSTVKDPATTDVARGWCRLMGLVPIGLFLVCAFVARNDRILVTFFARQAENKARLTAGLPPRQRRRRRRGIDEILLTAHAPPP